MNCLTDLSILNCSSNIYSEFFYQLSQICCNIQSLTIQFEEFVSHGLKDLISSQKNLKHLKLTQYCYYKVNGSDIISLLTKNSVTLTNLQELILSLNHRDTFEDFKELQNVTFPKLQILKFPSRYPKCEYLNQFLENHGKNLKNLSIGGSDHSLNLIIRKFCPNLKSLFTTFMDNEAESLKMILNHCQQLESIKVWCGNECLNEKKFLKILAKFSPKNFSKLKLLNKSNSKLLPEDLEEFFIDWSNRIPQKSLFLIIIKGYRVNSLDVKKENMKIIEKYKKVGVIKKFE